MESLFSDLVYDSIWKIALILNDSLTDSTGELTFPNRSIGRAEMANSVFSNNSYRLIKEASQKVHEVDLVVGLVRNQKS